HPDLLRDARDRNVFLHRIWLQTLGNERIVDFLKSEKEDLNNGDIPIFRTSPGSTDAINSMGQKISNVFLKEGYEIVKERIHNLSHKDLNNQIQIINMAMTASYSHKKIDVVHINPFKKKHSIISNKSTNIYIDIC